MLVKPHVISGQQTFSFPPTPCVKLEQEGRVHVCVCAGLQADEAQYVSFCVGSLTESAAEWLGELQCGARSQCNAAEEGCT